MIGDLMKHKRGRMGLTTLKFDMEIEDLYMIGWSRISQPWL